MHPGGVRSAMHLFNFEKSANLKHPNVHCGMLYYIQWQLLLNMTDPKKKTKDKEEKRQKTKIQRGKHVSIAECVITSNDNCCST